MDDLNQDEDIINPDERRHQRLLDSRVQGDGELSDSDDEGEGDRRDHKSHKDDEPMHGRKFIVTTGIMNAGPAASTHGAGPSGHPPAIPLPLASSVPMDVDDDGPSASTAVVSNGDSMEDSNS
jgi:histone deacetylase 1/2